MKETKYRAWDTKEKEMFKVWEINLFGDILVWDNDVAGSGHRIKDFILMQFTGLFDKSGKEIYKGDIVKSYYRDGSVNEIRIIEFGWWENSAYFEGGSGYGYYYTWEGIAEATPIHSKSDIEGREIIGNIYENPELLTNNN